MLCSYRYTDGGLEDIKNVIWKEEMVGERTEKLPSDRDVLFQNLDR